MTVFLSEGLSGSAEPLKRLGGTARVDGGGRWLRTVVRPQGAGDLAEGGPPLDGGDRRLDDFPGARIEDLGEAIERRRFDLMVGGGAVVDRLFCTCALEGGVVGEGRGKGFLRRVCVLVGAYDGVATF